MCLGHLYHSYPMFNSVQAGGWLELIPVDWQGIMAILEVLLLFNILQEARKNKRDIQMRVRSERLQFYAFFWKKWDRILEALPHGIFEPDFDASTHDREALIVTLRSYFDLCAQEYFMYTEGVIEESIWANWKRGTHFLHVTADFPRDLRPAKGGNVPSGIPRMACRRACFRRAGSSRGSGLI